jgi:hypothetical protein
MKTLTKLFLALGIALSLSACGGGGLGDDEYGYPDNGGGDTNSIYIHDLAGYAIYDYNNNASIYFCQDGSAYVYDSGFTSTRYYGNYNISIKYPNQINFFDQTDGGSYTLQTDGYLEVGTTYYGSSQLDYFTVSSIGYSGC